MGARREVNLHLSWQMPAKALLALVMAVSVSLYDDYLGQAQEYLMNYRLLMMVLLMISAVVLAMQVVLYPLTKQALLLPLCYAVGVFFTLSQVVDWAVQWWGFRYTPVPDGFGEVLVLGVFWWHLRLILKPYCPSKSALRVALFWGMLPAIMLMIYSYLGMHDFFAQRVGSYPEYQTQLYHHQTEGQAIDSFFGLTK